MIPELIQLKKALNLRIKNYPYGIPKKFFGSSNLSTKKLILVLDSNYDLEYLKLVIEKSFNIKSEEFDSKISIKSVIPESSKIPVIIFGDMGNNINMPQYFLVPSLQKIKENPEEKRRFWNIVSALKSSL